MAQRLGELTDTLLSAVKPLATGVYTPQHIAKALRHPAWDCSATRGIQMHLRPSRDIVLKSALLSEFSARVVLPTGHQRTSGIITSMIERLLRLRFPGPLVGHNPAIATGPGSLKDYYRRYKWGFSVSPDRLSNWLVHEKRA